MTTSNAAVDHSQGDGLRIVGSVAALLAAAGVLALGVSASDRSTNGNSDVAVEPGKVSVVGDAKVRRWDGQTFSVEVPLEWVKTFSGEANAGKAGYQVHSWALPASGVEASDPRLGAAEWSAAKPAADARVKLEVRRYTDAVQSRLVARKLARDLAGDAQYRFGDLGPVTFTAKAGAQGRYAWRLNMATAGSLESHYFFATCEGGKPREAWHVTFDRRSVRDMQPTLQSMLSSIDTTYAPAGPKGAGCSG